MLGGGVPACRRKRDGGRERAVHSGCLREHGRQDGRPGEDGCGEGGVSLAARGPAEGRQRGPGGVWPLRQEGLLGHRGDESGGAARCGGHFGQRGQARAATWRHANGGGAGEGRRGVAAGRGREGHRPDFGWQGDLRRRSGGRGGEAARQGAEHHHARGGAGREQGRKGAACCHRQGRWRAILRRQQCRRTEGQPG